MGVDEIFEQVRGLGPADRLRLRSLVEALIEAEQPDPSVAAERAAEAFDRLARGWCRGGGRPIAGTIDDVLYRGCQ